MTRYLFFLCIACLYMTSCRQKGVITPSNSMDVKVVVAKGYVVPKDSMAAPIAVPLDYSKVVKVAAGEPKVVATNTHIHPMGIPKTVLAGIPKVLTPGRDNVLLPEIIAAIDSQYEAGTPEYEIAKKPYAKDHNPQNFTSFQKKQGLHSEDINNLLQDKSGNLWFSDLGITKYDGKNFIHYSEKQGLPPVSKIFEDKSGTIWFGSNSAGIYKFDGILFTRLTDKEGLLKKTRVTSILEDKVGNLWIGTGSQGVFRYDGGKFTHFTQKQGLLSDNIKSIVEDKSGNLWFGTEYAGVCKYNGENFTHFTEKEGLSSNLVSSMLVDRLGNIWFGTILNGICKYDGKNFTNFSVNEGLSYFMVNTLLEDKNGNLWIGTNGGGISMYDGKNFTNYTTKEGLLNNFISSLLEDRSGNLWIASYEGLSKFGGNIFSNYTEKEGLSSNSINGVMEDKGGNLWIGTELGGICKYDGKNFTHITQKDGLLNNSVSSILEDKFGNLWLSTYKADSARSRFGSGLCKYDGKFFTHFTQKEGLSDVSTGMALEDKNGNLWFGTRNGATKFDGVSFTHYGKNEGLTDDYIFSITEDRGGNLWFLINGKGVCKYDGKTFTHFGKKEGFTDYLTTMLEDKSGNLWFGTLNEGVCRYDGKTFTYIGQNEGLVDDHVSRIIEDKSGNLWFLFSNGLSMLSANKLPELLKKISTNSLKNDDVIFRNYTNEYDFVGNCHDMVASKDGTIWISSDSRLISFNPSNSNSKNPIIPNIQLTSIALFNEKISWLNLQSKKDTSFILRNGVRVGDFVFDRVSTWYGLPENLSLAHNNNYLTFNFIGITLSNPEKLKYQYTLEGYDPIWSPINSSTEASYGNLSQGTYTFKVKARNEEGYWSKEFRYEFTIRPPWWKSLWAYAFYILSIISSIWYYITWREKTLRQRQKHLEQVVTERTAEVVAEKKEVEKQKKRSDDLLLNILPAEVAEELKDKGSADAKQFDLVTVLFTDFKNFTQISAKMTPKELVEELNIYFEAFDDITTRLHIEKIKTIGDSYMCAGGLPATSESHAEDVVIAGMEIQKFVEKRSAERVALGKVPLLIRIGIHSGPVIAGIVGIKKYAYDIWGDTVNTASRMESSGEEGKVNISGATYELVKEKFICTPRGKITAKNKGDLEMYFVETRI